MIRSLSCIYSLGLWFACLHAAQPAGSLPEREVNLRFTVVANVEMEPIGYRPMKDKALTPLAFFSADRSPSYIYKGAPELKFFAADADSPVAVCQIPEGMEKALLLFFPRGQPLPDGIKYDVVAVDDSEQSVPAGSFSIINVSGREFVAQFGNSAPITVPQGISPAYEASGRTLLQLARPDGGSWAKAGRHVFTLTPRARVWVLLYPGGSPTDLFPVIRRLSEQVPVNVTDGRLIARYP